MSGQMANERGEIVLSTRRRWSEEEKTAILAEAADGRMSVSEVARRHGLARDLLFRWRRELRAKAQAAESPAGFVAVSLPAPAFAVRNGSIEIVLKGDCRVIVSRDADLALLKHVIAILDSR